MHAGEGGVLRKCQESVCVYTHRSERAWEFRATPGNGDECA